MKFPKMIVQNFLAITQAELNFADRGLILLQGVNNFDTSALSNGAGKSSIADALCWVLYGTTARGASGDDVVNDIVGKDCRVEVHVQDGSDLFVITRHRKHKTGKNSLTVVQHETTIGGIKTTDLTKGTDKLTQIVVDKIVGASHDVFTASIYSGYEQMPNLPAMTDKNLKVMIEEASGTTLLEQAYEEARKRAADTKSRLATAENVLAQKQANFASLTGQHQTALTDQSDWRTRQAAKISAEGINLKALHADYQAKLAATHFLDPAAVQKEIDDAKARVAGVAGERQQLSVLERELNDFGIPIAAAQMAIDGNKAAKTRHEKAVADADHKVGCPCDSCGRPLTAAELASTKQKFEAAVVACEKAIIIDEAKLAQLKLDQDAKRMTVDTFKLTMTDVSAETELIAKKSAELSDIQRQLSDVTNAASQVRNLANAIKAMQSEVNPFDATVQRLHTQIGACQGEIAAAQLDVVSEQSALEIANAVVQVYAPAGVRAVILDEVTPYLNQQTSKYLAILSDGNILANWSTLVPDSKGNMKEKFSIEVENSKGAKTFVGLSGGQKRKVRLATALALQDLVATRAVKPIDLYIGDEIDDALDDAGLERLTQILDEKAQERGTVLIISHKSLTDWISNVIQIEMQPNGETKITEMAV